MIQQITIIILYLVEYIRNMKNLTGYKMDLLYTQFTRSILGDMEGNVIGLDHSQFEHEKVELELKIHKVQVRAVHPVHINDANVLTLQSLNQYPTERGVIVSLRYTSLKTLIKTL
jgi:hypothetical protein